MTQAWFSDDGDEMVTLSDIATGQVYLETFVRNEKMGWHRSGFITVERYALAFLVSRLGIGGESE